MLPALDDYLYAYKLRYQLTPSQGTDNQRILQYDWARGTTDNTQPKAVASHLIFPCWLSHVKNLGYRLIPFI